MPPRRGRESGKSQVLAALAATSKKADGTLDPKAKFILCDVCDRLITFVVFRTSKTGRDLCNVCRAAIEQEAITRKVPDEPLKIRSADGSVEVFCADDMLQYMGRAPKTAAALKALNLSETDDDEVHPNQEGVLERRLLRQAAVIGEQPRPPSKKPQNLSDKKRARRTTNNRQEDVDSSAEEANKTDTNPQPKPLKQLRTEKTQPAPPARRTLLSRRSSPLLQSATSTRDDAATPAPSSVERPTKSIIKPGTTRTASAAAAASDPSKALFPADEDDMPFFLSQTTLSAVAEATSQPIAPIAASPSNVATRMSPTTPSSSTPSMVNPPAANTTVPSLATAARRANQPAPSTIRADVDHQQYHSMISSGPVASLFGGITSVVSATEPRPITDRLGRLTMEDDSGYKATIAEGTSVTWQNSYVGLSRRVIMAAICPAGDAHGVWLSFACDGDQLASIDMWHAEATSFGTLETPKRVYAVSLGNGGVVGLAWVPVLLATPDNDTLGVCTVLRQKLLLSCQLPRRNVPASTIHLQIAGAQQIRVDVTSSPVGLQWHTTHRSVADTHLLVVFECSTVAIYQPIGGGLMSRKLNLAHVATVAPPSRRPTAGPTPTTDVGSLWCRRTPPVAVGAYAQSTSPAGSIVCVAIGDRDALAVMQGPSFELRNFSKISTPSVGESTDHSRLIGAIASTAKGFVLATDAAIHHYDVRRGDHKQVSTDVCTAAPIVALRELSASLLVCANAAGQVVQARCTNKVELKAVVWLQRESSVHQPTMPTLSLKRSFNECQQVPPGRASTPIRFAFHPFTIPLFGNIALAYYPDGAWVLFPSSNERK